MVEATAPKLEEKEENKETMEEYSDNLPCQLARS